MNYNLKDLWAKACAYDGIPEDSMFVVFSDENPYIREYNNGIEIIQKIHKGMKVK